MPIYMDVHIVPGVKAGAVAEAHQLDLACQEEHGCKCMTYWIDEERENVFCLIEAPSKEAVVDMHNQAHGLIPHKIIEVNSNIVESFLGRIYDPETAGEGLKVFKDPSYRLLLLTGITDPVLLCHRLGKEKTNVLLNMHNAIIRKNMAAFDGREAEYGGAGFILSFASAERAVSCAMAIIKEIEQAGASPLNLRIAIDGGEPVQKGAELFGDTIRFAGQLCKLEGDQKLTVTSAVKELVEKDKAQYSNSEVLMISPSDEQLLRQLFSELENNWQNSDFDASEYGQSMAMSRSQLYRKSISLTGLSPNLLLKEYRLDKAKDLMKKQKHTVAQVSFECGFTSPSYFTKCFKKKYGLLPMEYLGMID